MKRTKFAMLVLMALPSIALCDAGTPQWSDASKPTRTPIEGMKTFYEPENVVKDGDTYTFKLFASPYPSDKREGEEYSVNCETKEVSQRVTRGASKEWLPPYKILPGETLFPIVHKLCDGGPSLWKRLMD